MSQTTTYHNALQMGSMLLEYRLDSVLGAGGFGMTYLGWDTHLEKHVAIKEYLPTDLAVRALDGSIVPITTELQHDYQWGLERFILDQLTPIADIEKIRSSFALKQVRYKTALPLRAGPASRRRRG